MAAPDQRNFGEAGLAPLVTEFNDAYVTIGNGTTIIPRLYASFKINPRLTDRRVYVHLEPLLTTPGGDYAVGGQIIIRRQSHTIAILPASVAQITNSGTGVSRKPSVAVSSNFPTSDSIKVSFPYYHAAASTSAILVPTRIKATGDEIAFEVKDVSTGLTGGVVISMRVYIAVISSDPNA